MKILLTGGSSFTGYWFIHQLSAAGHQVVATFRRAPEAYVEEPRRGRVTLATELCRPVFGVSFGDDRFLSLVGEGGWDVLAHHGAEVTDYRSPDFDVVSALQNNTRGLRRVLEGLEAVGCRRVLLTGSIFEQGEGAGSDGLPAFSAYGLSKGLTFEVFRHECRMLGMHLGKFVIPNPFGPLEEPRYTSYLARRWLAGKTARCETPAYVRDNIHVSLLARAYATFLRQLPTTPGVSHSSPSGYVESQGTFTRRFAQELRVRLGVACDVELAVQSDFREPRVRINTDVLDPIALGWDEAQAWDELARFYLG